MSRARFAWTTAASALLAAAWLSPRVVPYNMDEFVHYHALGCATAQAARELPTIRDGCGYFDLRLPGTRTPLPLRSYLYIGSVPALPFYPYWRLVQDPVAVRLAGAVWLLVATVLAAKVLRLRASPVVLASLVFPIWPVTFLVDEGPVGLSAVLLLAGLLAARRALAADATPRAPGWAVVSGFCFFLGVWTKLVFAWWLPVAVLFLIQETRRESLSVAAARSRRPVLLSGLLAFAAPAALLLASADIDGRPYLEALRQGGLSTEPDEVEAVAVRLGRYATDGSLVAPRNLLLPGWRIDIAPMLLAVAILALGLRRGARRREAAGWALVAALTFAFVAASGHSRWPHHFAFPMLPLVLALALAVDALHARERRVAALVAAAFWATLAARVPLAEIPGESSPDKDRLLAFVRERGLDREALQVHASWGTYYIAQLFGDEARRLVYARRVMDDPPRLRQVAELASSEGRPLLLVSARRWDRLHTPAVEAALGPPRRTWRFGDWWAVEYRPLRR